MLEIVTCSVGQIPISIVKPQVRYSGGARCALKAALASRRAKEGDEIEIKGVLFISLISLIFNDVDPRRDKP